MLITEVTTIFFLIPENSIRSLGISTRPVESSSIGVESLARRLRHEGVVGRSAQDRLLLDMRTVRDEELAWIAQALAGATEP